MFPSWKSQGISSVLVHSRVSDTKTLDDADNSPHSSNWLMLLQPNSVVLDWPSKPCRIPFGWYMLSKGMTSNGWGPLKSPYDPWRKTNKNRIRFYCILSIKFQWYNFKKSVHFAQNENTCKRHLTNDWGKLIAIPNKYVIDPIHRTST